MGLFVENRANHRAVIILPMDDLDPGLFPRCALPAFGDNHQIGRKCGAIVKRDGHARCVAFLG